jgi:FkbM family methyltransferase
MGNGAVLLDHLLLSHIALNRNNKEVYMIKAILKNITPPIIWRAFKKIAVIFRVYTPDGARICPQKSKISGDKLKINEFHQALVINQLVMHKQLLCEEFSGFTNDLLKVINLRKERNINVLEIKDNIYYKFLLNQNDLKKVWAVLDGSSRLTWYYLILVWVSTWFFAKNAPGFVYDSFYDFGFFRMIQDITGGGYNFNNASDHSTLKEQYLCDNDILKPGMIVIDSGAFTGDTAEIFSAIVGNTGMVYSFEPTESSFKLLQEKKLANVQCIQKGLYEKECELIFEQSEQSPAANKFIQTSLETYNQIIKIPVTSIDKFVNDNNISRIDFIKMDIEGSELNALKGAKNTINENKPDMAICIYHNLGNDMIDIPIWLVSNFGDIYNFKIMHHSKGWGESVIYANKKLY